MDCNTPGFLFITNSRILLRLNLQLSWWCHPIISSSVVPFSSCLLSFPKLGSFPMSQLFASGSQSIGASTSAPVLPMSPLFTSSSQSIGASASAWALSMNIQSWFPLGLTGLISLLSKGLSKVFSSTTIQKHQFFGTQLSLWFNSHICTWLLEQPLLWLYGPLLAKGYLCFLICCLDLS